MYDGDPGSVLFNEAEFRNTKICTNGETSIENSAALDLFKRKKVSVYVEGLK